MIKSYKKLLFIILIFFSSYCAVSIGFSWDEGFLIKQGKSTANYLLSLGLIEPEKYFRSEFYSPIYYALRYLFVQAIPKIYQFEANHLVNLFFSLATIIGIKKISEIFFNKEVGKLVFLILFFYPVFFGHMGFNSKDTIIAFCNIWIFYYIIKYLFNREKKFIYYIAVLSAVGTGLNLFFLGSLIPIILFFLIELFLIKKFNKKELNKKEFIISLIKGFLIFYFLLVLFWVDTHHNIVTKPLMFFYDWAFSDMWRGYPHILVNGEYYSYNDIPKSYLITNLIYKSPEYFLVSYIMFFFLLLFSKKFFLKKIIFFNYKITLLILMILYPFILLFFTPFSIYDGLRHVLWMLPYLCILPALAIYYLIKNFKDLNIKIISLGFFCLVVFFMYNFLMITPYQYTYLNILNGKKENHYKRFENDYWGGSLKELVKKIDLNKNEQITLAFCGMSKATPKYYLKKNGFTNFRIGNQENSKYVIMTNRSTVDKNNNLTNCFDKFAGDDVYEVSRNGVKLSVIRKLTN